MLVAMDETGPVRVRRSTFLLVAASAVLSGCTTKRATKPPSSPAASRPPGKGASSPAATESPTPTQPTVDVAALRAAIARETALLEVYTLGVMLPATKPDEVLQLAYSHHVQHLAELRKWLPRGAEATATSATRKEAARISSREALLQLAKTEAAAADKGVAQSIEAGPVPLSVLLAQIAASEAQHSSLIRALAARVPA